MGKTIKWEVVARKTLHPVQVVVLTAIAANGKLSPVGLTELIGDMPLSNVSYHVKALHELELLELAGTKPRRGAIEHFYRLARKATA